VLPDLLAGKPTRLGPGRDDPEIQLAPAATVPPIVVGGMSEPAMARAATFGDGWFTLPVPPSALASGMARLAELAADQGRPTPALTASMMTAIDGDAALPEHAAIVRALSDPDGVYGIPADQVDNMIVSGGPAAIAARIAELAAIGAERVTVTLAAGSWHRQAELLAEAHAQLT
jgi:alkanesulfonate monooxygenase SsuD/methylene tetrahydromethanopterin reductase-like flavin-dependent oxidoreductase (luciferase family)